MSHVIGSLLGITALLTTVGSAAAAPILDDFNDGVLTGWTVRNGQIQESGGSVSGTSGFSLMTFNGGSGTSLVVDAFAGPSGAASYVALVLGYADLTTNIFVKIQDNNFNGLFDRVYFYKGNAPNSVAVTSPNAFDLASETASAQFSVIWNGAGTVTAFVDANFDGIPDDGFSVNEFDTSGLGAGIGLGLWHSARADNFGIPVPEPGTGLLVGLGLFELARQRRRALA